MEHKFMNNSDIVSCVHTFIFNSLLFSRSYGLSKLIGPRILATLSHQSAFTFPSLVRLDFPQGPSGMCENDGLKKIKLN